MTALLLIAVLALVLLNGFFVAAEFALVRVRRGRLEQMAREGQSGSETALEEVGLAVAFAYTASTAAHITIGEQVPKIFAITRAEATARRVARPLKLFYI